jgi:uncharacterized protein YcbK (DUF882 family)
MIAKFFREKKQASALAYAHPMVVIIMLDMLLFIENHNKRAEITSFIRSPELEKKLGAVSSTHREARAFDLHCNSWDANFMKEFKTYFANKYQGFGAISSKTHKEKLIYVHNNGNGKHCHVQLTRNFATPNSWIYL